MKKALIISTVSRQFYLFEQGNIEVLKSLGYEVHCAANYSDANERLDKLEIIRHDFDIQRSPFSLRNIKAYRQLKIIMKQYEFDLCHCHSPMGGVIGRLAAKSIKIPKILYTAHGFHFYKGAPLINWLLFYPIEKIMSGFTDILITINREDYKRSQNFRCKEVKYVPGIGVDVKAIRNNHVDYYMKRKELGLNNKDMVLLSVGELNKNKNHESIINAIGKINNENLKYIICGKGKHKNHLYKQSKKLEIDNKVIFLGYRNDIRDILKISDIFVFPSFREGLSVSLMEAMSMGLPCIVSRIRGNIDLVQKHTDLCVINPRDVQGFSEAINILQRDKELRRDIGHENKNLIEKYDLSNVKRYMMQIYNS